MESTLLFQFLTILFLVIAYKFWSHTRAPQNKSLPPSPPSLPILGHLHLLKEPLHRCLRTLSQDYGPIISLRFGSYLVIVVSSPSAVEECFTKNDVVLANRRSLIMGKYICYNCTTLSTAPYSDHWRNLRRISTIDIFSSTRLNAFATSRKEEVKILLGKLFSASSQNGISTCAKVVLRPMFSELAFNTAMQMVAGKRYDGEDNSEEARQLRETIAEIFEYGGASYLGDFLPILKWVDFQGYVKRARRLSKRVDRLFQGLIDEQRSGNYRGGLDGGDSMIGHLLSLQESQPEYYADKIIKGLILDIIFAGTESTAVTMEWAMSELLNNPEVLEKAKYELDDRIGQERLMDEPDISKLPYLQHIISETLRLHPPGPLLVPHYSSSTCIIGGYTFPSNTMVLVNAWAMHRDPKWWDIDALSFKPERFENGQSDASSYKYIPFGMGRRACPGASLANRLVGLTLGLMIQCFEWKRVTEMKIDMAEGKGLTMPKAELLEAMCNARDNMNKLLSCL